MPDESLSPSLRYRLDENVAVVTLDDGKANAIDHDVLAGLRKAVDRAESEAGALVLVGGSKAFSAGFNLGVMTESLDSMRGLVSAGAKLLMRLYGAGVPTVAACTGHALAGGALVLLACDERIGPADKPAKIGLNEVAIGMGLPVFAVEMARDRLAPSHVARSVLGEVYDPSGAVDAGFLDRVVPADSVIEEAMTSARAVASLRRGAVARTKDLLRARTIDHVEATLEADLMSLTGPADLK